MDRCQEFTALKDQDPEEDLSVAPDKDLIGEKFDGAADE